MRKTIKNVTIVVPVLITSCHVSLKPKIGPSVAQTITVRLAKAKAMGRPVTWATNFAKRVNQDCEETKRALFINGVHICEIPRFSLLSSKPYRQRTCDSRKLLTRGVRYRWRGNATVKSSQLIEKVQSTPKRFCSFATTRQTLPQMSHQNYGPAKGFFFSDCLTVSRPRDPSISLCPTMPVGT